MQNPPVIKWITPIIAFLTMIGPFSIDTYLPSFPDIEAEFSISRSLLSQSLGFYLAAFAIATLIIGPLADRLGRRTVILVSLFLYILTSIGCALSPDYNSFLVFRMLQGISAAGGLVAGRAIIRDVFPPAEAHRAMSRIMMLFALAPAIAPVIGGILHESFGWRSIFYFLTIFSFIVWLLFFIYIPETLNKNHRQSVHPVNLLKLYSRVIGNKRFILICLVVAFYFSALFLYISGAPSVIYDFIGLGAEDFGYLFIPMVAGLIAGSWLSGRLAHRWIITRTIKLALIIMAAGSVLSVVNTTYFEPSVIQIVLPLSIYTIGIGIAMPAMTILALDCFPENRGMASAVQGSIQMIANAITASILMPLLITSSHHFALAQLVLFSLAVILWINIPDNK